MISVKCTELRKVMLRVTNLIRSLPHKICLKKQVWLYTSMLHRTVQVWNNMKKNHSQNCYRRFKMVECHSHVNRKAINVQEFSRWQIHHLLRGKCLIFSFILSLNWVLGILFIVKLLWSLDVHCLCGLLSIHTFVNMKLCQNVWLYDL